MLKCRDVTRFISSEQKTNLFRRLEIRLHLLICKHCRNFYKQIEILKSASKKFVMTKVDQIDEAQIRQLEDKTIAQTKNRGRLE